MENLTYNGICSRCESMFPAPVMPGNGPVYCPGCSACSDVRNTDLDLREASYAKEKAHIRP